MQLAGKRALVTGASHGIGKAIALAFAREGADVALTFRGREEGARDTERQIAALGRRVSVRHAEVTDLDDCPRIVEDAIRDLGGLEVLVNNAGGGRGDRLLDLSLDNWRYTLDLCVTAPFVLGQSAARHMAAHGGGAIINISSVHSAHVWPNDTAYGVAKAGLNRLTASMAVEWAHLGIRANTIAPGYINVSETPEEQARYDATDGGAAPWIVAQRTARPEEMAAVAVFLASDAASYVTGQTLFADGGLLLPAITTANYMRGDRNGRGFSG
jgi:NAD(P)-dependent dehydrogenase (short-subunit alcohol dehydrogenase family)